MDRIEKQAKETDEIKSFLNEYTNLQKRIDSIEKRLEYIELTAGAPPTPNYSGMPGGNGDGSSKQERDYIKKEELKEKLGDMYAEENRLREQIEEMIELLKKPNEQTVIEMHYLDGTKWWPICEALFEDEPDYEEYPRRYLKRTHKIHGAALRSLARIYKDKNPDFP